MRATVSRSVRTSIVVAGVLIVLALVGLVLPHPSGTGCCADGPSFAHPLGTDPGGRDLLRAALAGLATSAWVVALATALALLVGTLYGTLAAGLKPRSRALAMRLVDVAAATPVTLIVVTLVVSVRSARDTLPSALAPLLDSRALLVVAVASLQWLGLARVVHTKLVELRERPFVQAARIVGVSRLTVFARHVVPHASGPLFVVGLLALPSGLVAEGFISFLGFGVERPHLSLGLLIADGARAMAFAPLTLLVPSTLLVAFTVALQVLGARLREELAELSPRRRRVQ